MTAHVPQRELRNNPGAILARVERGEELTVTVRGRPVADLIPTRERPAGRRTGWRELAAGVGGILADDERLETDVREGIAGAGEDPFERWA